MIKPEDAGRHLNDHFEQITLDEFKDRYDQYSSSDGSSQIPIIPDHDSRDVILYQRQAAPLRLDAYLASALTGLDEDEREQLFAVSDIVTAACEELGIIVYEPRKSTDPTQHPDVPAEEVFNKDRERVLNSDLIIHIADLRKYWSRRRTRLRLSCPDPYSDVVPWRFNCQSYGIGYSSFEARNHI